MDSARTLIDLLLAEQQQLSATERFAQRHASHELPAQARYYRDLIPLTKPRPGEQYAFEVDLDKCSGCKACVTACHSLNGLDDGEAWRNVGLLVGTDVLEPFQQTVTTACHHCVDPACLNGCPVLAYDKDPVTGIVHHLDDQCIGCQYCVMKCPYDVPKFSSRRGIVRKCDMCANRLADDEAPACVQGCPNEAIKITLVDTPAVTRKFREHRAEFPSALRTFTNLPALSAAGLSPTNAFLPASPEPSYTVPTTRYRSEHPFPSAVIASDHAKVQPADPHTPLVFMLVLSQLAVGLLTLDWLVSGPASQAGTLRPFTSLTAWLACLLGLGLGALHLGRPWQAWRGFLGWRKSWLSREMILFAGFANLASAQLALLWLPKLAVTLPALLTSPGFIQVLSSAVVATGWLAIFASVMIYADTRRDFWRLPVVAGKFFGTTLLLGAATLLLAVTCSNGSNGMRFAPSLLATVALAGASKLAVELRLFRYLSLADYSPLHKSALIVAEQFGLFHRVRVAAVICGAFLLPLFMAVQLGSPNGAGRTAIAAGVFALCLAGELMERRLFFVAVQPVGMPGLPS